MVFKLVSCTCEASLFAGRVLFKLVSVAARSVGVVDDGE